MKKLIAVAVLLGLVASAQAADKKVAAEPAKSTLTAKVTLAEDGGLLWCHARILGIARGQTVEPTIKWTAPDVFYVRKNGEKLRIFQDSTWTGKKVLGDPDPKNPPCVCTDTGEKNCARTKATRTLKTVASGKEYVAKGTWKVEVVVGDVVIGSATYEVK